MSEEFKIYAIAGLTVVALIICIVLLSNNKKSSIKKNIDDLTVRFNTIKSTPLAFKLNKAQVMAKRSDEASSDVKEYYKKYEETEKHIEEIQELMNQIDESFESKDYSAAKTLVKTAEEKMSNCEVEVKDIDKFLEEFTKRENEQRELSTNLKEKYRVIKNTINDNSNVFSIAYDGLCKKLSECEDLFTSSEEYMFANDFINAQNDLDNIDTILDEIKKIGGEVPELIKDTKGVLPIMIDEAKREFALTKQRGVFLDHLNVDQTFANIDTTLNEDLKKLLNCEVDGIKENVSDAKDKINNLMESFERENRAFKEAKETNDKVFSYINDLAEIENYVRIAYDKDSARFGLENLKDILKKKRENIEAYRKHYQNISIDISSCLRPSTNILDETIEFSKEVENDKKELYTYKTTIDKSTDGEVRAKAQLIKLQLVISEVETKVKEYHLPIISKTYDVDLIKSKEYINKIKSMLKEIPIDIDNLNLLLDEAIDFIYKFYNNVNNVVGMAVMVESAIVFGNKYRSSYSEIDQELSKAEFQYLNGEYTKALKTAITCMETLFPDNADEKILENS